MDFFSHKLISGLLLRSFRKVMVKLLHCDLKVNKFDIQSHNYVHFRTNSLGKAINTQLLVK